MSILIMHLATFCPQTLTVRRFSKYIKYILGKDFHSARLLCHQVVSFAFAVVGKLNVFMSCLNIYHSEWKLHSKKKKNNQKNSILYSVGQYCS